MKRRIVIGFSLAALCTSAGISLAAEPPAAAAPALAKPAPSLDNLPMVPPARPGVFTVQNKGANRFHLVVAGHTFTSRDAIEKYLAWRAADLTQAQHANWFTFIEKRTKGDSIPVPTRDPAGLRYSFRMEYFRPVWRYKLAGDANWKNWNPFSGVVFFADGKDAKTITDFAATADIVLHKGLMDDADPLAFEAGPTDDLLINQVSPPQ